MSILKSGWESKTRGARYGYISNILKNFPAKDEPPTDPREYDDVPQLWATTPPTVPYPYYKVENISVKSELYTPWWHDRITTLRSVDHYPHTVYDPDNRPLSDIKEGSLDITAETTHSWSDNPPTESLPKLSESKVYINGKWTEIKEPTINVTDIASANPPSDAAPIFSLECINGNLWESQSSAEAKWKFIKILPVFPDEEAVNTFKDMDILPTENPYAYDPDSKSFYSLFTDPSNPAKIDVIATSYEDGIKSLRRKIVSGNHNADQHNKYVSETIIGVAEDIFETEKRKTFIRDTKGILSGDVYWTVVDAIMGDESTEIARTMPISFETTREVKVGFYGPKNKEITLAGVGYLYEMKNAGNLASHGNYTTGGWGYATLEAGTTITLDESGFYEMTVDLIKGSIAGDIPAGTTLGVWEVSYNHPDVAVKVTSQIGETTIDVPEWTAQHLQYNSTILRVERGLTKESLYSQNKRLYGNYSPATYRYCVVGSILYRFSPASGIPAEGLESVKLRPWTEFCYAHTNIDQDYRSGPSVKIGKSSVDEVDMISLNTIGVDMLYDLKNSNGSSGLTIRGYELRGYEDYLQYIERQCKYWVGSSSPASHMASGGELKLGTNGDSSAGGIKRSIVQDKRTAVDAELANVDFSLWPSASFDSEWGTDNNTSSYYSASILFEIGKMNQKYREQRDALDDQADPDDPYGPADSDNPDNPIEALASLYTKLIRVEGSDLFYDPIVAKEVSNKTINEAAFDAMEVELWVIGNVSGSSTKTPIELVKEIVQSGSNAGKGYIDEIIELTDEKEEVDLTSEAEAKMRGILGGAATGMQFDGQWYNTMKWSATTEKKFDIGAKLLELSNETVDHIDAEADEVTSSNLSGSATIMIKISTSALADLPKHDTNWQDP